MILAIALSMLIAAQLAPAPPPGSKDGRRFESDWTIEPIAAPAGVRTIKPMEYLFRQRLLPPSLARLRTDAVDAKSGKLLAAAGSQLFGLRTFGEPLFCAPSTGFRYHCFADLDRDGALDGHFRAASQTKALPNLYGTRPQSPDPVRGGAYDLIDPKQTDSGYFAGLLYSGSPRFHDSPRPVFAVMFGRDGNSQSLTSGLSPTAGTNPPRVEFLGAEVLVTGNGAETIDVEVRSTYAERKFGVVRGYGY
ncbi:MAG TPA: hypothetical protein VK472_07190 [Allosphingosinicella sp.]|nr:hypothetical protein [Allosphingosinicella sp.]